MKIGFIGLGIMGKPMAKNFIKAGYEMVVLDHKDATMEELVHIGAKKGRSPKDVGEQCDVVITMLPNSPHVKEVTLGENGLIYGMKKGSVFIDMSSISPIVAREVANALGQRGIRMLDAPVSGGEAGAINGELAIMVGGNEEDFMNFKSLLQVNGKSVEWVGGIGSGNVAKLVNQSIVAINIAAVAEAMMLGKMADTDPERIFTAIQNGSAGSNVLNRKLPLMLKGAFEPGFRLSLHEKDLGNVLDTARSSGVQMPLTEMVAGFIHKLVEDGDAQLDHSALIKYYEKLNGEKLL